VFTSASETQVLAADFTQLVISLATALKVVVVVVLATTAEKRATDLRIAPTSARSSAVTVMQRVTSERSAQSPVTVSEHLLTQRWMMTDYDLDSRVKCSNCDLCK
jgi:hypothetical protein